MADSAADEERAMDAALMALMQRLATVDHGGRSVMSIIMDELTPEQRAAAEESMDRFAARMREAGQPGW